jgi:hypothetical protein
MAVTTKETKAAPADTGRLGSLLQDTVVLKRSPVVPNLDLLSAASNAAKEHLKNRNIAKAREAYYTPLDQSGAVGNIDWVKKVIANGPPEDARGAIADYASTMAQVKLTELRRTHAKGDFDEAREWANIALDASRVLPGDDKTHKPDQTPHARANGLAAAIHMQMAQYQPDEKGCLRCLGEAVSFLTAAERMAKEEKHVEEAKRFAEDLATVKRQKALLEAAIRAKQENKGNASDWADWALTKPIEAVMLTGIGIGYAIEKIGHALSFPTRWVNRKIDGEKSNSPWNNKKAASKDDSVNKESLASSGARLGLKGLVRIITSPLWIPGQVIQRTGEMISTLALEVGSLGRQSDEQKRYYYGRNNWSDFTTGVIERRWAQVMKNTEGIRRARHIAGLPFTKAGEALDRSTEYVGGSLLDALDRVPAYKRFGERMNGLGLAIGDFFGGFGDWEPKRKE